MAWWPGVTIEKCHEMIESPDMQAFVIEYRGEAVGVRREYERGTNGAWHDGLLMELLASDIDDIQSTNDA